MSENVGKATPKKGKGSAVLIRVTQETRDALDAEVERTGRSLSQVAEIWLDEARRGRAAYQALLGGTKMAAAIEQMVDLAAAVEATAQPEQFKFALMQAWKIAIPEILPTVTIDTEDTELFQRARTVRDKIDTALNVIKAAEDSDPVKTKLLQPIDPLGSTIEKQLTNPDWDWFMRGALNVPLVLLKMSGDTAKNEIDAALKESDALEQIVTNKRARIKAAEALGVDVANAAGFGLGFRANLPSLL